MPRGQGTRSPSCCWEGGALRLFLHPDPFNSSHPKSCSDTSLIKQIPFGSRGSWICWKSLYLKVVFVASSCTPALWLLRKVSIVETPPVWGIGCCSAASFLPCVRQR